MKIKDLRVHIISAPLAQPFQFSQGWVHQRDSVIVEVETMDGVCGFGECLCHGRQQPFMAASFIEQCYKPHVIGQELLDVDVIWETLYNSVRPIGQQGICINAQSGIDIAIWDAIGKTLGQPVCRLLGGKYRDKIPAYATGFYRVQGAKYPETAVEEALSYKEKGFRGMKLKVGFGVEDDVHYIRAVREALGYDTMLMADFNCAYNLGNARQILYELEDARLEFLEELLPPEDLEGYVALRNLTGTKLAAGECLFGKQNFRRWLERGALDIYQPDLCSSGGFTECRKLGVLTQSYNTALIPHVWGSGVGLAASLQFIASLVPTPLCCKPVEPMVEYDQSSHPFRLDLIDGKIEFRDGCVSVPDAPGIGVEVDRRVLEKYRVN
ncbi:mandelate racemase/muconate lactonizing enzyme family protein [Oscillibacter sp.]|uniref:mandelate racemase/muconate lactonizing enzyme family protein n=1 Tax=Oscillibacter sp. TaxID=1945593 RepID=UPI002635DE2D|nr:mandelate racemase/muconate lactonizing enzyme family protein [Oscillibacter sp.]MDD3347567.1 mandelate racemase/muconate lactonizing enzyme family protein [Oscillibacter sp.]